jgi:hypothetical protein
MKIKKQLRTTVVLFLAVAVFLLFAGGSGLTQAQQAPTGKDAGQAQPPAPPNPDGSQIQNPASPWTPPQGPETPDPDKEKRKEYETQC